jgi:hypothetical protein
VRENGFEGRLYSETGRTTRATASWGNHFSFWPTLPTLERELFEAGYEVLDQVSPPHAPDRRYFVARRLGGEREEAWVDATIAPYNPITDPEAAPAPELYSRVVIADRPRSRLRLRR